MAGIEDQRNASDLEIAARWMDSVLSSTPVAPARTSWFRNLRRPVLPEFAFPAFANLINEMFGSGRRLPSPSTEAPSQEAAVGNPLRRVRRTPSVSVGAPRPHTS